MTGPAPVEPKAAKQPLKKMITVKSRYLETPARKPEHNNMSIRSSSGTSNSSNPSSTRLGKGSKTSTPTKDTSLFNSDISVVSFARHPIFREKLTDNIAEEVFLMSNMEKLFKTINIIVKEERAAFAASADNELSAQQRLASESATALSDIHKLLDAIYMTNEIESEINFFESCIDEIIADPAARDADSFKNILEELEKVRSQLLCKNVRLPRNQDDYDKITEAATKLANKLEVFETHYEKEISNTADVKRIVSTIETTCNNLKESTESAKELIPVVTASVLEEVSQKMMKAGLSNFPVKF